MFNAEFFKNNPRIEVEMPGVYTKKLWPTSHGSNWRANWTTITISDHLLKSFTKDYNVNYNNCTTLQN